jgi:NADPH-dependent 2,4-dienoyl-CoA reductase/sulfur reductase-like enzyme
MTNAAKQFDVLVVGGGPAGMAAAVSAAECDGSVGIVDDNPQLGGQIWRGETENCASEASRWFERLCAAEVEQFCGMRIIDQPAPGLLRAETSNGFCDLGYRKLVLATGARERFLPFPGWTLPNVMGAGSLQALVKSGLPIEGKRVVVAGTGPLLLAVAAYLRKRGAEIVVICEQASRASLAKFGLSLLPQPQKIAQALSLRKDLSGIRLVTSCWPVAAGGDGVLKAVTISHRNDIEKIPCDYLACGFHLVPNTELPALVGCSVKNRYVEVDDFQQTSIPSVFCAGEPTGIGGVELSLIEGQIAGLAATGKSEAAQKLFSPRTSLRRFARRLDRGFALRPELKKLALPETIVCRCEDVTYASLRKYTSWRAAKLQTRCGMGPCQGRVCGPATQFFLNWKPDSLRPPVSPTMLENLAAMPCKPEQEHSGATRGPR